MRKNISAIAPDPRQAGHDRPAPQQPARQPRDDVAEVAASAVDPIADVVPSGPEARRRVQPAAADEEILVDLRPLRRLHVPPTTTSEPSMTAVLVELRAAEDHDDVAIDPSFDGGVAEDHRDFAGGLAGLERVALADAEDRIALVDPLDRFDLPAGASASCLSADCRRGEGRQRRRARDGDGGANSIHLCSALSMTT